MLKNSKCSWQIFSKTLLKDEYSDVDIKKGIKNIKSKFFTSGST